MAKRVRVPLAGLEKGERLLEPKTAHYLREVLRLRAGDTFVVFDPDALLEADARFAESTEGTYAGIGTLRAVSRGARSVARAGDRADAKRARLEAIALDASRQSGRADVPKLVGPHTLERELEAWREVPAIKLCLVPGAVRSLRSLIADWSLGSPIALLIGPEGGFADGELASAEHAGFVQASFGELVLRTEIAGVAALGALLMLAQA